ncbi:hypothetical protein [Streptomyces sp. MJP52]|uniref:hypothetical protein n=1 Tax=Streptomyces sp. MJP52 TaxID=2940555 RepID=UPI0024771958|nr:hypothetical protein [Streptomyces sp. MJP52]MDH6223624.1 hypothetical protein [Streptomyces sp. MJP52]
MTKDRRRKAAIRAEQQKTGRRYTQISRELAVGTKTARTFRLADLLKECATLPAADVAWGYDADLAPLMFRSECLGADAPYGSVLQLAGLLSDEGRDAQLSVESLSPLEEAVVRCGERRVQLLLSQDRADLLCQTTGCTYPPAGHFGRCDTHLADCTLDHLTDLARAWGYDMSADRPNLAERGGSTEADLLIKAATAVGAFEEVCTVLLDSLFEPDDLIDEVYWDEADALAARYEIGRERLRLRGVAQREMRRVRTAGTCCRACEKPLDAKQWNMAVPAQYCGAECLPAPEQPEPCPAWPELWTPTTAG